MSLYIHLKKYLTVFILLVFLLPVTTVFADDSLEAIQQRIKVLEQEAAQTTHIQPKI